MDVHWLDYLFQLNLLVRISLGLTDNRKGKDRKPKRKRIKDLKALNCGIEKYADTGYMD